MNHNEAKHIESQQADGERAEELRGMPDGYYWAKSENDPWQVVHISGGMAWVAGRCDDWELGWFSFGPRIEEPKE